MTAALELGVILLAWLFPGADLPLDHLVALLAASATSNVLVALWRRGGRAFPRLLALGSLAVEVLLLTGLLELTGGPFNPFSVLYVVHIALAAVTIGRVAAWAISGLAVVSYAVLFYWHTRELVPGHHRLNDFPTHLFTVWIAVATTAELVAYFIVQASSALARRETALEAMRVRAARSERVISLTTLAAGAAHELSTPLATIALAARELERAVEAGSATDTSVLVDDARLIRAEVDRCQAILDQMSGRAGGSAADHPELVSVDAMLAELTTRVAKERVARLHIDVAPELPMLHVPRAGLSRVVLSLINNAFDASPADAPVRLTAQESDGVVRLAVHDRGQHVADDVLQRAGEPFFTTKEPGRGLGLGLFLARVFAERFGGSLTLESSDGTTATLELPWRADAATMESTS